MGSQSDPKSLDLRSNQAPLPQGGQPNVANLVGQAGNLQSGMKQNLGGAVGAPDITQLIQQVNAMKANTNQVMGAPQSPTAGAQPAYLRNLLGTTTGSGGNSPGIQQPLPLRNMVGDLTGSGMTPSGKQPIPQVGIGKGK